MIIRSCVVVFAVVGIWTTTPSAARAQSPSAWPGVQPSALQTVFVRDHAGTETKGKLLTMGPDALVLVIDGSERRIPRQEVARIQARDGLRNGAIIGASFGLASGVLTAGLADCPTGNPSGSCPAFHALMVPMSAGVWAAIGAGIDALIPGRRTIYTDPENMRASFSLGGSIAKPRVQLNLSW